MITIESMIKDWEWEVAHSNSPLWEGAAKNILYVLHKEDLDLKHKRLALRYYGRDARGMSISMWYEKAADDLSVLINRERVREWQRRKKFEKMEMKHSGGSLLP